MQNNQQQYYRLGSSESCTPNNYSIGQNSNNQQRFNNTQFCYDSNNTRTMNDCNNQRCQPSTQNSGIESQQCTPGYRFRPTSSYGQREQAAFHPIDCCEGKGINTVNQQNQFNRYERNGESNSYNCFDRNIYSPSSLTNRALNIHMNGLYSNSPNSKNRFQQQPNLFSSRTTNDIPSNLFEDYQRKSC